MQEAQPTLATHGASVIAIVVDSTEANAALSSKLGVQFPILSDPDLGTIRAWGVEHVGENIALPATLVVSPDGRIAWAYVGDSARDRPLVASIVAALHAQAPAE